MFLKKFMLSAAPLVICALLCILFPLIKGLEFFNSILQGLLLGLGFGVLLPLTFGKKKNAAVSKLLWTPAALLTLVLLYQYLTYYGMLIIPALSFLNIVNAYQSMIEMAILTFLGCILFVMRK
jgi:hypothetical protein